MKFVLNETTPVPLLGHVFLKFSFCFWKRFRSFWLGKRESRPAGRAYPGGVSSNRKHDTRSNRHTPGRRGRDVRSPVSRRFGGITRQTGSPGAYRRRPRQARFRDYLRTHALVVRVPCLPSIQLGFRKSAMSVRRTLYVRVRRGTRRRTRRESDPRT